MIQEEDSKKKEEMNHATSLARRLAQPSLIILIICCPFISDCPYAYIINYTLWFQLLWWHRFERKLPKLVSIPGTCEESSEAGLKDVEGKHKSLTSKTPDKCRDNAFFVSVESELQTIL